MCLIDGPLGNREGDQQSPSQETGRHKSLTGALRHLRAVGPERTNMRISLSAIATFVTTAALAHSGHGEIEAMHHSVLSPLNGFEPLALSAAGLALIAYVIWKRT